MVGAVNAGKQVRHYGMSYKELATALIQYHNLHAGHWKVSLKFGQPAGLQAQFANYPGKPLIPSVMVPVLEVALVRHPEEKTPDELCVDAREVNPAARVVSATAPEIDIVTGGPRH